MTSAGTAVPVYASDQTSAAIEELQLTLGEGPCVDANTYGRPVLVADLSNRTEGVAGRWPLFHDEASRIGVRAVFAFLGSIALAAAIYTALSIPLPFVPVAGDGGRGGRGGLGRRLGANGPILVLNGAAAGNSAVGAAPESAVGFGRTRRMNAPAGRYRQPLGARAWRW